MDFDVYKLIPSVEMREYLRKCRKFKPLEQEVIIRNSYYPIEQKLKFMKHLVEEARKTKRNEEETRGYSACYKDNDYRLSERVFADTHYFRNIGRSEKLRQSFFLLNKDRQWRLNGSKLKNKKNTYKKLDVKFYDEVADVLLKFAVIVSKTNGKWVFCKHKERETYEVREVEEN